MNNSIVLMFLGDFFYDARCINMANTIIDAGMELNIIDAGTSGNYYREKKIHHISLPANGINKYIKFYLESKIILNMINTKIIIAGDLYSLSAASSITNAHIVYDSRELYTQLAGLKNKIFTQKIWSYIEKKHINKVQSVLVTAKGDGLILNKLYRDLNIFHIYNYPSLKLKPTGKYSLRKKLNISNKNKIFLYQGVLHKGRGIKTMIKLLAEFENSHAVIIGDGYYKNELQNYVKKINLRDRVHFFGKVPYLDLLELTSEADLGFSLIRPISKSYKQALPNKLFEYAIAGIPIIASNLPEMEKVINKYQLGYTVAHDKINTQKYLVKKILTENKREIIQKQATKHLIWENQKNKFLTTLEPHG